MNNLGDREEEWIKEFERFGYQIQAYNDLWETIRLDVRYPYFHNCLNPH